MKCPKCGYIGFEATERCRNCGYDFSLTLDRTPVPEFSVKRDDAAGPLADLPLGPQTDAGPGPAGRQVAERRPGSDSPAAAPGSDLPLFSPTPSGDDDRPLITPSPTPRPPLAVRRTPVPVTRQRTRTPYFPYSTLGLQPEPQPGPAGEMPPSPPQRVEAVPAATAGRRLAAAAIDVLILGGLDVGVLYFTLRLCRLTPTEVFILPVAPLLLFFLILNGGYLLAFTTAGGQTIGKMAVGIKVVTASGEPLTLRQAMVRTAGCVLSVAPAGLGFVPFLLVPGRRALHDRLAGTWVVKVSTP